MTNCEKIETKGKVISDVRANLRQEPIKYINQFGVALLIDFTLDPNKVYRSIHIDLHNHKDNALAFFLESDPKICTNDIRKGIKAGEFNGSLYIDPDLGRIIDRTTYPTKSYDRAVYHKEPKLWFIDKPDGITLAFVVCSLSEISARNEQWKRLSSS